MNVIFEIGHPSYVHNFKNVIWRLSERGHSIKICAIGTDVTFALLDAYGLHYENLAVYTEGNLLKSRIQLLLNAERKMLKVAFKFKPDVFVSGYSPVSAHVSTLMGRRHIAFDDTENTRLTDLIIKPFTDVIYTPSCFMRDLGKKQVRYNGYKELSYLHPKYFKPDPEVLHKIGVKEEEPIIFLRFVSWRAHHDIGQHGVRNKMELIKMLESFGRVLVSSEEPDPNLDKYTIKIAPEDIHSLLSYSRLYVGDGATMATEAGVLGTPSIYVSTFKGTLGNFIELENKYSLVYSVKDEEEVYERAREILVDPSSKADWIKKRDVMLSEKIDVADFMIHQIERCGRL